MTATATTEYRAYLVIRQELWEYEGGVRPAFHAVYIKIMAWHVSGLSYRFFMLYPLLTTAWPAAGLSYLWPGAPCNTTAELRQRTGSRLTKPAD